VPPLLHRLRAIALAVVLVLAAFLLGVTAGGHPGSLPSWLKGPFVDEDTRVVAEAVDRVHHTYYRKVPRSKLADTAIAGMVQALDDRFSSYFTPAEYRRFQQQQSGEFSGVGMTVNGDRRGLRVVQVFDDSPAHDAGIRPGDIIVAVDGQQVDATHDLSSLVVPHRPGDKLTLRVNRDGQALDLPVTLGTLPTGSNG